MSGRLKIKGIKVTDTFNKKVSVTFIPSRAHSFFSFLFLFLMLGIVFLPSIYFNYLHHDDVFFWLKLDDNSFKQIGHDANIIIGRYTAAWLIDLQGLFVHKVSDLRFLRILAVLVLTGNAFMLLQQFQRFSWSYIQSFLVVSAIFFLPGFAENIFYISNSYVMFSILFACWSFRKAEDGKSFFIPSAIFLIAIMFYPSGAMFYWTMVGMSILFARDRIDPVFRRNLFRVTKVGLTGLLSYAVLIFLMSFFHSHEIWNQYNPYEPSLDWSGKLYWFFHEPILNALNLWSIYPKWSTAFIVTGFIISAFLITCFMKLKEINRHHGKDSVLTYLWQFVFFIFIFFLTFLPNLVASLNAPFYRCLIPLTSLIFLILIWAIIQWIKFIPAAMGRVVMISLLSIAVIYGGIKTFNNVLYYRVLPSHVEWNLFRMMAKSISLRKADAIYIVCPNHIADIERYDEFGGETSQFLEDIFPLLISAFQEERRQGRIILPRIYISKPGENGIFESNQFILKRNTSGKLFSKNIGKDEQFHEVNPLSDLGSQSPRNQPLINIDKEINAYVFLKINRPYILELRQTFSNFYKIIETGPQSADAYYNRGNIYKQQGNLTGALSDYNKVIELEPDYKGIYNDRGTVYSQLGNLTQALSDYNKAIEIDPEFAEAYNNRANTYKQQGKLPEALSDFNKAIKINPQYAFAYANRGNVYAMQGNLTDAISDFNMAIELRPDFAGFYNDRGFLYAREGDLTKARGDARKTQELGGAVNPELIKVLEQTPGVGSGPS